MKTHSITGTIVFLELGSGGWGIETPKGQQYFITNMPEQLKKSGAQVTVLARPADDYMGLVMWGEAVELVQFSTLG